MNPAGIEPAYRAHEPYALPTRVAGTVNERPYSMYFNEYHEISCFFLISCKKVPSVGIEPTFRAHEPRALPTGVARTVADERNK